MTRRSSTTPIRPTATGAHDEDRDPEVQPLPMGDQRGITSQHQELAMGEVDHPHHAEDDRKAQADEHEIRDRDRQLQADDESIIHA